MPNLIDQYANEIRDVFFDETQFGEWFVLNHGTTVTRILGRFARPYEAVAVAMQLESSRPVILVATADIPALSHGDTILRERDSTQWVVYRREDRGHGLTLLALMEAA